MMGDQFCSVHVYDRNSITDLARNSVCYTCGAQFATKTTCWNVEEVTRFMVLLHLTTLPMFWAYLAL